MEIAVTGSSGLVGSALRRALIEAGHRPIAIVRREPKPGADEIRWDPTTGEIDATGLEGVDVVVNLAGMGIGERRWTDSYKNLLVTSRTGSTALLATTLAGLSKPPQCLLSGSAIGIYGNRGSEELTEASDRGEGFLADLAAAWEAAAEPATDAGIRTAFLRTGIVLSAAGGALAKMVPLFKLGLGGRFGRGNQYQSWISLDDEVSAIIHLMTSDIRGPVNLTAPQPVTNRDFTTALGAVLARPTFLPVPAPAPKLLLGAEMAQALLFDSLLVLPAALLDTGYEFKQSDIEAGLRAALGRRGSR